MTDEKSTLQEIQARIDALEDRRRGLQEKRARLGEPKTEQEAAEALHLTRQIDDECEEIDFRLSALRFQESEAAKAVQGQDNERARQRHNDTMLAIYRAMRQYNQRASEANNTLERIDKLLAALPAVRAYRPAPGGGLERAVCMHPAPWSDETALRRRIEPLQIVNEKFFAKENGIE